LPLRRRGGVTRSPAIGDAPRIAFKQARRRRQIRMRTPAKTLKGGAGLSKRLATPGSLGPAFGGTPGGPKPVGAPSTPNAAYFTLVTLMMSRNNETESVA